MKGNRLHRIHISTEDVPAVKQQLADIMKAARVEEE